MENTSRVYAELTTRCNLHCPHCKIRTADDHWNQEKFLHVLQNFNGDVLLFGGEPTLYPDRLFTVISDPMISPKIKSISTNLVEMSDDVLEFFKKFKHIGTSWNPKRFNDQEYQSWLNNLNILAENDVQSLVMITMTEDLFEYGIDNLIKLISTWNSKTIEGVRFEYLVGDTDEDYYIRADRWQYDLYTHWTNKIPIDTNLIRHWYFDCSNTYTLHPDGTLDHGCPNHRDISVPEECYTCERASYCKPCWLHKYCSFPKSVYNEIIRREGLQCDSCQHS